MYPSVGGNSSNLKKMYCVQCCHTLKILQQFLLIKITKSSIFFNTKMIIARGSAPQVKTCYFLAKSSKQLQIFLKIWEIFCWNLQFSSKFTKNLKKLILTIISTRFSRVATTIDDEMIQVKDSEKFTGIFSYLSYMVQPKGFPGLSIKNWSLP